jgi:hypothetical protein
MELTETGGISEPDAARLMQRAVEIDSAGAPLTATQLREVARESGISAAAFEQAFSEMRNAGDTTREVGVTHSERSTMGFGKGRSRAVISGALLLTIAALAFDIGTDRASPRADALQDATINLSCLSEADAAVLARDYLPKGASTLQWNAAREPGVLHMHAPAQSIREFKDRLAATENDGATVCSARPSK